MREKECRVEVFSRVTGFFRPVQSWNEGKTAEFAERKRFKIEEASCEGIQSETSRTAETITG